LLKKSVKIGPIFNEAFKSFVGQVKTVKGTVKVAPRIGI
jgi:hypothetical protein